MMRTARRKTSLPVHVDVAADVGVEAALGRAVGVEVPAEQLARPFDGLEHDGAGRRRRTGWRCRGRSQSVMRDERVGADDQDLARRPWRSGRGRRPGRRRSPEQAAFTSKAPQRSPSSCCTVAAWPGPCWSGVVVARTSTSMSGRVDAGHARAPPRPASTDRPAVVPPTRRSRMPVRSRIHSSLVSIMLGEVVVGDDLVGQGGAPAGDDGTADAVGDRAARQAVLSQAMGWRQRDPLAVDRDVALQHAGERRAHLVVAHVAEHVADADARALVRARRRG